MFLKRLIGVIDTVNDRIGRLVAWMTFLTVLVAVSVALLRYVFDIGFIWMQESYIWMHGLIFMLGAGYTLLHGGHVRVDVFYSKFSPRGRAWVDLLGVLLLLLPMMAIIAWTSWGYVANSWEMRERSPQPGGLPATYFLKSAILFFCALVALQGLSLAAKSLLVLKGGRDG
ncbi:MAG TPA: TRAP transporter small permease subunit [Alphaproteobacteria bacterium]|nr:TRAP transporter small permease subunit [Alphaproteobacteria bacterium]